MPNHATARLSAQVNSPFARNVFNCCNHFNLRTWFLTPAYIFQVFMSSVDRCTHDRAQLFWNCSVYVLVCVASTQTHLLMTLILFCLSLCLQDYSKTCARIWMKFCVSTGVGTGQTDQLLSAIQIHIVQMPEPENLKSKVGQTGISLRVVNRSQDALQRDAVYSML